MVGTRQIDDLQLRKRALVLESDLNRMALDAEWRDMRAATAWAGEAVHTFHQLRPWLPLLAPLGGILAARELHRSEGILSRCLAVAKWIQPLWAAWKKFSMAPTEADERKPAQAEINSAAKS